MENLILGNTDYLAILSELINKYLLVYLKEELIINK